MQRNSESLPSSKPSASGDANGVHLTLETLITPSEAARSLPSGIPGKKVHIATVHRWFARGDLEFVKIGGRCFTSAEAISRFISRCNRRTRNNALLPMKEESSGTVAARKAMVDLEKMGV